MAIDNIKDNIYSVGANDPDRRLFDELIPLPDGTSYNAYLIIGSEKTALIDTVDPPKADVLLGNLEKLKIENLDYIISNHAEQDHSGSIPDVLKVYPRAKIVTNRKCRTMLMDLLLVPEEKFITIEDKDTISLGDKTFTFFMAPWVHWPETMFTYLKEDNVLFSCDFLGSHFASDELFVRDEQKIYTAAKRYYAEIMMPFKENVKKNLKIVDEINPEIIATSHGPIYKNTNFIIKAYRDWVSDYVKNEVIIPYISMHGSTERMVDYFVDSLNKLKIEPKPFNLTKTDIGELAISLVDAATIVVASPTVLTGPHPNVVYAGYLVKVLRPKAKFISVICSYGWGGKTVEQIKELLSTIKAEIIDPVVVKGYPKDEDFKLLDELAGKISKRHKENNIN